MSRLVLAFYGSVEHAEEALHEVRKNDFRLFAIIHRMEDGHSKILYAALSPYSRGAFAAAFALAITLSGEAFHLGQWARILLPTVGFLITWFGSLWLSWGLPKKTLQTSGLSGCWRSLVVVKETENRTTDVIAVLRRIANPSVFAIRPGLRLSSSSQADRIIARIRHDGGLAGLRE